MSPKAVEILEKTEEVSVSPWFQAMNEFQPDNIRFVTGDSFPSEVIKPAHLALLEAENRKHKKDKIYWWDEWVIYPCSPGEMPEDVSTTYSWLLYRKHYGTESTDTEKSHAPDVDVVGWREIIKQALPEVTELYSLTTSKESLPEGLTNTFNLAEDFKCGVYNQFEKKPWIHITKKDLEINYSLIHNGKERRNFVSYVLENILVRHGHNIPRTKIRDNISR